MSLRFTRKLPSLANVAAGSTATLLCPVGRTYHQITLAYSGVTRAQLQNINVLINGKVVMDFADGDEVDAINDYYGRSDTAGVLTLYFRRPEQNELIQQRTTGLGTLDVDTLELRIDIDAAAAAPVISAWAILGDPEPLGAFIKVRRFPASFATSGKQEISNLPKGPRIVAAHLFKADISAVDVVLNGVTVFEATKTIAEAIQKENGRAPVTASCTHVDFCLEGDLGNAVVTHNAQDLRFQPTLDTSGQVNMVVEYLDGYAGI